MKKHVFFEANEDIYYLAIEGNRTFWADSQTFFSNENVTLVEMTENEFNDLFHLVPFDMPFPVKYEDVTFTEDSK